MWGLVGKRDGKRWEDTIKVDLQGIEMGHSQICLRIGTSGGGGCLGHVNELGVK